MKNLMVTRVFVLMLLVFSVGFSGPKAKGKSPAPTVALDTGAQDGLIVNGDSLPRISYWKVAENSHLKNGVFLWDTNNIMLQKHTGWVDAKTLLKGLKATVRGAQIVNATVGLWLLANQSSIPLSWRKAGYVVFVGDQFKNEFGVPYILCIYFSGRVWQRLEEPMDSALSGNYEVVVFKKPQKIPETRGLSAKQEDMLISSF